MDGRRSYGLRSRTLSALTAVLGLALGWCSESVAYIDENTLIDRTASGTIANRWADDVSISDDGRYATFTSAASNLVPESLTPGVAHVFAADLRTNEIELVSRGDGTQGTPANSWSRAAAISGDGRYVTFTSSASNLTPLSTGGFTNVYVRDLLADRTELISRATGSDGEIGQTWSTASSISDDGRYVLFESLAPNLSDDDYAPGGDGGDSGAADVFIRDRLTNETRLVGCLGDMPCTGDSYGTTLNGTTSALSDDGRYVAFLSSTPPGGNGNAIPTRFQLYVRDLIAGTTEMVSRDALGAPGNLTTNTFAISGDGRTVAFNSAATNLTADDDPALYDTFSRELATGEIRLLSRADGVAGEPQDVNDDAYGPIAITDDGTKVAFTSPASNLSVAAASGLPQVFIRDTTTAETDLVSRIDGGFGPALETNGLAEQPGLSGGGDFVTFVTDDPNLAPGGRGGEFTHAFRRQITGEPEPPELGRAVQLAPGNGTVAVKIPISDVFEELERGTQVPVGSVVDATAGALEMRSDSGVPGEAERQIVWSDGQFTTSQGTTPGALTEIALSGPLVGCEADAVSPSMLSNAGEAATPLLAGRKAWGKGGKGHKSKGGKSSASVRGTKWLVWDTCDGETVTYVSEGVVEVEDFERNRTVSVRPGEIYVAPGPPDTTISSGPGASTRDRTPTFDFAAAAAERWNRFECRVDGGAFAPCSSPLTSKRLDPGAYVFQARATDEHGSADVPWDGKSFFVRGELPVDLSIAKPRLRKGTSKPVGKSGKRMLKLAFKTRDDGAQFLCSVDGAAWDLCDSPLRKRVGRGRHTVEVAVLGEDGSSRSRSSRWAG